MSFYVTLPSTASRDLFRENKPGKYTTNLARAIDLNGMWEVGLAEIMFPPKKITLSNPGNIHVMRKNKREEKEETDKLDNDESKLKPKISKRAAPSIVEVKNKVERDLGATVSEHDGFISVQDWGEYHFHLIKAQAFQSYSDIEKILNSALTHDNTVDEPLVTFRLVNDSWHMDLKDSENSHVEVFLTGNEFCKLLGITPTFVYKSKYRKSYKLPSSHGFEYVYVYCDIVEHGSVGDAMALCLRTIPFQNRIDGPTIARFENPHYIPLLKNSFSTVEVELADDEGNEITFRPGLTMLKLHFRPRKL
jgi:hypothetical protein